MFQMSSVVDLLQAVRRIDNAFSISVDKIHSSRANTATTVHAVENVIFDELFLALFGVIVAERRPCSDSRSVTAPYKSAFCYY